LRLYAVVDVPFMALQAGLCGVIVYWLVAGRYSLKALMVSSAYSRTLIS
jgi:hypothetical protein